MKTFLVLGMMFFSFTAFTCDDQVQSVIGDDSDQPKLMNSSIQGTSNNLAGDCLPLDNIKAVFGYVHLPQGWLGGIVGIGYALSAPIVGGNIIATVPNNTLTTISGCSTSTQQERVSAADDLFNTTRSAMLERQMAYGTEPDSPEFTTANRWIRQYQPGSLYTVRFPDDTSGFYRIQNDFSLVEENCG